MTAENEFGRIEPAEHAIAVVPSDVNNLARLTRGVYVGATGNLHVLMGSGQEITFTDIAAGVIHPIEIIRVYATGTTATNIVALW